MIFQHSRKSRPRMAVAALATGLLLMTAGCSGDDGGKSDADSSTAPGQKEDKPDGQNGGVIAEVKGGESITLTIDSAKREEGGFVTVTGKVTNGGSGIFSAPGWAGDESELSLKNDSSMAGAKLVDKKGKKRYYILRDTEGRCLCTRFTKGVKSGDTMTWYAQFPSPPENTAKVDFQIADMPPASIEISEG
ncbi:hypothetical protein H181DRAFT_00915 [Streptomyces sp. WMMB 714]|nr:hypothetical protein H181DRAFT_00915 [Streptomyces sp. WMMB 714]